MPRYRFTWDNFDDEVVEELAKAAGYQPGTPSSAREWLSSHVKRPNDQFVRDAKSTIENAWLKKWPRVARSIVEYLLVDGIGPRERPKTDDEYVAFIRRCRNSKTVRRLIYAAMVRFGDADRNELSDGDEGLASPIPRFAKIAPGDQKPDDRKPHPYQEEAWELLSEAYSESHSSKDFRGLLVMPTGSGKTYTAVRWLLQKHINQGGRVLWVAHRHDLLSQAAQAFHQGAFLAPSLDQLRVRVVSGVHHQPSTVGPEDHVVVWSVQSLARRLDLAETHLGMEDVFLVIDEAHHAPAATYQKLFDILERRNKRLVLGLTATPTRTIEEEGPILNRLFGGRVIHEVPLRLLVEQQFLSRPYPEIVDTKVSAEQNLTSDDIRHLEKFGDLSEAWQDRLAKISLRNDVIVDRYLKHRERYGKTLIFAINVAHAQLLRDRLREEGVDCEYVASYRMDEEQVNHANVIDQFRKPNSGLDVLINVEILTEGVDIPCIQTVFLTRPTRSEILLRQMIGRALRGPKVTGGTENAYLVSFEDHWSQFTDWEHPFELVSDIIECTVREEEAEILPAPKPMVEAIPWDLIKASVDELRRLGPRYEISAFEAVPHGWYVLEREDDGEEIREVVHVYEHQKSCWEAFIGLLWDNLSQVDKSMDSDSFYEEYFLDCDLPRPSRFQIGQVFEHFRAGGERPPYFPFSQRTKADPNSIAQEIWDQDLGVRAKEALIATRHELPLAKATYPELRDFTSAIDDAIFDIKHPDRRRRMPKAEVLFEPMPNNPLRPGPAHDLEELLTEVLSKASSILPEGAQFDCTIR